MRIRSPVLSAAASAVSVVGLSVGLFASLAAPAAAQEDEVSRDAFRFLGDNLMIDVTADPPGRLRVLRGSIGRVEVAALAPNGVASFGLNGTGGFNQNRLSLTALGGDFVNYIVVIPHEVRARVKLPDRAVSEVFGTMDEVRTFTWGERTEAAPGAPAPDATREDRGERPPARGLAQPPGDDDVAYRGRAPESLAITGTESVRTLSVRLEGDEFRIETGRPSTVTPGDPDHFTLRATGDPMDVVVVAPEGTGQFLLRFNGEPALLVLDGRAVALCEPVVEQELDGDRRWFTFSPVDGSLECEAPRDDAAAPGRSA